MFNWGASYEKLRQASLELKITPTSLVNFSDTRLHFKSGRTASPISIFFYDLATLTKVDGE